MRLLICGSRDWDDYDLIKDVIVCIGIVNIACIIQGENGRVDTWRSNQVVGADWLAKAVAINLDIPHLDFPANWRKHGKGAGPIRNKQMLVEGKPTHVLAFHDRIHEAKGTGDMIQQAEEARVPVAIVSHKNECGWILGFSG